MLLLAGCYSCKSFHNWKGDGPVAPEVAEKFFWDKDCVPLNAAEEEPETPEPKPVAPKPVIASTECGPYIVSRVFPGPDCGVVRVDKTMPKEVSLNATFDYSIRLTNLTDVLLTEVVLVEDTPKHYKYANSDPPAEVQGNRLTWTIDRLEPNAAKEIKVVGSATRAACLEHCATVTYVIPACAYVNVVAPKLTLAKSALQSVIICDPIEAKYVVTNAGSGVAKDVKVTDVLPANLLTTDGKKQVSLDAGSLGPGQSKSYAVKLKAQQTGSYTSKAVARSGDGLVAESAPTTTLVTQPVLVLTKVGPKRAYIGRRLQYTVRVMNKGNAAARDTVIEETIPAGVTAIRATAGARIEGSKILWDMGTLASGESKEVTVSYMKQTEGLVTDTASATAYCAEGVKASASTAVEGIAAILLEVIDIDDPVEIGAETTYVITATNQGSQADTNIEIVCTLEDAEQYVSSRGATIGTATGQVVRFAPLASLGPKAKATWQVRVKALKPGDIRFRVEMNTDQLERPVEETEATRLYE